MKNKILLYTYLVAIILATSTINSNSQPYWNVAGNVITANQYLGANAGSVFPLLLLNNPPLPIWFGTNFTTRMLIHDSTANPFNEGFVGIGTATPVSLLHLEGNNPNKLIGEVFRTDCPTDSNTFWRMFRNGNEMGKIYSRPHAILPIDTNNLSIMASRQDITFHTILSPPQDTGIEDVRIVGATRPSTSDITQPLEHERWLCVA